MVNSHHWYWHLSWPLVTRDMNMDKMMNKIMDRRGELFYFVHRAMLQRYNIERLTNKLEIATPLNYNQPILPEYNAHLTEANSGQDWVAREGIKFVQDIDHRENPSDPIMIRISDWFNRRDRVFKAIKDGKWVLVC
jgi:tyrosinase